MSLSENLSPENSIGSPDEEGGSGGGYSGYNGGNDEASSFSKSQKSPGGRGSVGSANHPAQVIAALRDAEFRKKNHNFLAAQLQRRNMELVATREQVNTLQEQQSQQELKWGAVQEELTEARQTVSHHTYTYAISLGTPPP